MSRLLLKLSSVECSTQQKADPNLILNRQDPKNINTTTKSHEVKKSGRHGSTIKKILYFCNVRMIISKRWDVQDEMSSKTRFRNIFYFF